MRYFKEVPKRAKICYQGSKSSGSFAVTAIDATRIHIILSLTVNGQTTKGAEDAILTGTDPKEGAGFVDFKESDGKGTDNGFFESGAGDVYIHLFTTDTKGNKLLFSGGPKSKN